MSHIFFRMLLPISTALTAVEDIRESTRWHCTEGLSEGGDQYLDSSFPYVIGQMDGG